MAACPPPTCNSAFLSGQSQSSLIRRWRQHETGALQAASGSQLAGLITEHVLLDLAGRRLGQCAVNEGPGDLEVCQAGPAECDELLVIGPQSVGIELQECTGRLAPFFVRSSDDSSPLDGGMLHKHFLHLNARDVLTTRYDDVLGPILDLDRSVRMPNGNIP